MYDSYALAMGRMDDRMRQAKAYRMAKEARGARTDRQRTARSSVRLASAVVRRVRRQRGTAVAPPVTVRGVAFSA